MVSSTSSSLTPPAITAGMSGHSPKSRPQAGGTRHRAAIRSTENAMSFAKREHAIRDGMAASRLREPAWPEYRTSDPILRRGDLVASCASPVQTTLVEHWYHTSDLPQ